MVRRRGAALAAVVRLLVATAYGLEPRRRLRGVSSNRALRTDIFDGGSASAETPASLRPTQSGAGETP